MSIPHCFDHLISVKPKHPQVGLLSQVQDSVDEVAPPLKIPGLNLTQFNQIGTFRQNIQNIYKHSTQTCRTKKNYSIRVSTLAKNYSYTKNNRPALLSSDMNYVVSFLHLQTPHNRRENVSLHFRLNWKSHLTPTMTLIIDQSTSK